MSTWAVQIPGVGKRRLTLGQLRGLSREVESVLLRAHPRRKHTPYNPNACPICAPCRCEKASR